MAKKPVNTKQIKNDVENDDPYKKIKEEETFFDDLEDDDDYPTDFIDDLYV